MVDDLCAVGDTSLSVALHHDALMQEFHEEFSLKLREEIQNKWSQGNMMS